MTTTSTQTALIWPVQAQSVTQHNGDSWTDNLSITGRNTHAKANLPPRLQ